LEDLDVGGISFKKWILNKSVGRPSTGLMWLKTRTDDRFSEGGEESFGSIKCGRIF
jgi:hypothetical protein